MGAGVRTTGCSGRVLAVLSVEAHVFGDELERTVLSAMDMPGESSMLTVGLRRGREGDVGAGGAGSAGSSVCALTVVVGSRARAST